MYQGPVFIFSLHRSGGTLLMRLLNCHPDLVIWGEHGGIINQFAEIDDIIKAHQGMNPIGSDETKLQDFVHNQGNVTNTFAPWANPLTPHLFQRALKKLLNEVFSPGLAPGQRWGFKEIRYFRLSTAEFLSEMFPQSQFILLQRDLMDAAISNILAPWSLQLIREQVKDIDDAVARKIVEDVAYGLLAFESAFAEIKAKFPLRTFSVDYSELRDDGFATITRVAEFLQVKITDTLEQDWRKTFSAKLGTTDKSAVPGGALTRELIIAHLEEALPELRAQFAVDKLKPLLARSSRRRRPYAALLGDHTVKNATYTTIF